MAPARSGLLAGVLLAEALPDGTFQVRRIVLRCFRVLIRDAGERLTHGFLLLGGRIVVGEGHGLGVPRDALEHLATQILALLAPGTPSTDARLAVH